jgi:hypothetical protein
MTREASEHDDILAAVLAGDLTRDDEKVQELLRDEPEFRERLGELERVASRLGDAATLRREVLTEAARGEPAPGLDRVDAVIGARLRERAEKGGAENGDRTLFPASRAGEKRVLSPFSGRFLAAAAVVLVAATVFLLTRDGGDPGEDLRLLGGEEFTDAAPRGKVSSFAEFRWTFPLAASGTFEVLVYDGRQEARSQADREPIGRSFELRSPLWQPRPEEVRRWPDEIEWEVLAFDGNRVRNAASGRYSASRSSH